MTYKTKLSMLGFFSLANAAIALPKLGSSNYSHIPTLFRASLFGLFMIGAHYMFSKRDDDEPPLDRSLKEVNSLFMFLNAFIAFTSISRFFTLWTP